MTVATTTTLRPPRTHALGLQKLNPNDFSLSIYGDPAAEIDDLLESMRDHGILVPLVVTPEPGSEPGTWEVISGHRRLACARALHLAKVPCEIRHFPDSETRRRAVLEYNRQRRKSFSQRMREADAIEEFWTADAKSRRLGNLRRGQCHSTRGGGDLADCRNSDDRGVCKDSATTHDDASRCGKEREPGRTDAAMARQIEIGGKDLYRQARAIWRLAQSGDIRAQSGVAQLDAGTKTIHAAYKDLRRRDRFSADFRPTPYDVWSFRHDRAFGIPHPGAIPPGLVAHTLHYFTPPGGLVVDPMAGGGTTLDVCESMGRRCLAYDLTPRRADIRAHDIRDGFPVDVCRGRPDLLRPSLSHHARATVRRRINRDGPALGMGRVSAQAGA